MPKDIHFPPVRTDKILYDRVVERAKKEAIRTGYPVTVSNVIRKAIDQYLKTPLN